MLPPGVGRIRRLPGRAVAASGPESHPVRSGAGQHAGDGAGGVGIAAPIDDVHDAVLEGFRGESAWSTA